MGLKLNLTGLIRRLRNLLVRSILKTLVMMVLSLKALECL